MARDHKRICDWCGRRFISRIKTRRFCDGNCQSASSRHRRNIRQQMINQTMIEDFLKERERRDR